MKIVFILLKLVITIIIGQTLFYKFSGADESVYIFNKLGVEPWGRIVLGMLELLSIILLWMPQTILYALLLILGMMSGAIASHLLVLGIEIRDDGGELFMFGVVTWICAAALLIMKGKEVKARTADLFAKKHTL